MKLKTDRRNKIVQAAFTIYTLISLACTIFLVLKPTGSSDVLRIDQTQKEIELIRHELEIKNRNYEKIIDSLSLKNDSLQRAIERTGSALLRSKVQAAGLKKEILRYISQSSTDTVFRKNSAAFDSLSGLSTDYIAAAEQRDSLCTEKIYALEQLADLKEASFKSCDMLLQDCESSNARMADTAGELSRQLQLSQKENKKKRRWNRILSATALVLSGFIISSQLNH